MNSRPLLALVPLAGLALPAGWVVHHIAGHGNVGFGRGHNLALSQRKGKHAALLNSDTIVHPGAIRAILEHGLLFGLITDEATAKRLVTQKPGREPGKKNGKTAPG